MASKPQRVIRIVGPSGIGKSRLILEALGSSEQDEQLGYSVADLVLYTDESEMDNHAINSAVQSLAENRQPAVVVVNHCLLETHRTLVGMVKRQTSLLSLVTIDYEIPSRVQHRTSVKVSDDETTVKIPEASMSVIEAIINSVCPELPSEDFRRLACFSRGFPKIAHLVAQAWRCSIPVPDAVEEHYTDSFIVGRRSHGRELLLESAQLLAAFHLVRGDHLVEVATWGRNLSALISGITSTI